MKKTEAVIVDPSVVINRKFDPRILGSDARAFCPTAEGETCKRKAASALGLDRDGKVSPPPKEAVTQFAAKNGFFAAFMLAYNQHLPLRLNPDTVWVTVVQAVARFIHDNAETYRDTFVEHATGKVKLRVLVPEEWDLDPNLVRWDQVLDEINALIAANTKTDVVAAFQPTFSTTDIVSRTAINICTMSAMQNYFDYDMSTMCGIGEVHMDGTLSDWEALRDKARVLATALGSAGADLAEWLARIDSILGEFVATARHAPKLEFWQHAYSNEIVRGSGGGTYLSGWVMDFFFANAGPRRKDVDLQEVCAGTVTVPISWERLSGRTDEMLLTAGTWCVFLDEDNVVGASPQWAISTVVGKSLPKKSHPSVPPLCPVSTTSVDDLW